MSDGNRAALAELIAHARKLVANDGHGNCAMCDHDVDVCDCGLSKLRHAVLAWDDSTPHKGEEKSETGALERPKVGGGT